MYLTDEKRRGDFRDNLLYLLIYLIFFQDYIGLFLFNIQSSYLIVKCFLALKDVILLFLLTFGLMVKKQYRYSSALVWLSAYAVIVFGYFLLLPGKSIGDLRGLLFPVYCMWAGYLFDDIDNKRFLYHLKTAVITSSLLALCIYLMGPKLLVKWNLLEYTEQARGFFGLVTRGLPATFYNFFGGITLFRLAAGIMNPIATATLVIFTINILFSSEIVDGIKNVSFVYWILILTTVLTFSRGPILGAVLAIPVGLMFWRNKIDSSIWKKIFWIFFLLIVVGIIGIGVFQNMFESSIKMQDSSSKGHYYALLQSWEYLQNNWMGSGIGSSGQWAESDVGAAVENSYAMIIGQVGSIAFFFLAGAYFLIIRNCLRRKDHFLSLGLFLTFIMMLINAFFSPSLMSVTPLTLFWFLVGYFETSTPEIIEAHS